MCAIPSSFSYIRVFKVNTNVTFQVSSTSIHKIINFIVRASMIDRRNVQHDFFHLFLSNFPCSASSDQTSSLLLFHCIVQIICTHLIDSREGFYICYMVFNLKACYPYPAEFGPNYPKTILVCRFFIYYAVPLSIIAFFYILMARHLIHSTRNIPGEMQCQVSGKKF